MNCIMPLTHERGDVQQALKEVASRYINNFKPLIKGSYTTQIVAKEATVSMPIIWKVAGVPISDRVTCTHSLSSMVLHI